MFATALELTAYPAFRRVEFRGKRRIRRFLPVPERGERVVGFAGGFRLRLDLREPLQRDFLAGVYDHHELRLLRRLLRDGGDFVDVGAHIGMYSVAAAVALGGRGRVLAFEPNPVSRGRLEANLALNRRDAVVVGSAVSASAGRARLAVPIGGDAAWSTLEPGRLDPAEELDVETTTVDREVSRLGLEPVLVKVDVEGHELAVLDGTAETLSRLRPALLCELGPETASTAESRLRALGYRAFRVALRRLVPLAPFPGLFNALFLPPDQSRTR